MTWQSIAIGLMALVVLCWGLGAYNRLVRLRAKVRADFVPVHEGLEQAAQWLETFNRPVYLLGGVGPEHLDRAWQIGAQGVAGIRAFWP